MSNNQATVRLVLEVTYDLNEEEPQAMANRLRRMCEQSIGHGMLTGHTSAEVDQYVMDTVVVDESMGERAIADLIGERIESGALDLESIPMKMAQYGLMDPGAFRAEMKERATH